MLSIIQKRWETDIQYSSISTWKFALTVSFCSSHPYRRQKFLRVILARRNEVERKQNGKLVDGRTLFNFSFHDHFSIRRGISQASQQRKMKILRNQTAKFIHSPFVFLHFLCHLGWKPNNEKLIHSIFFCFGNFNLDLWKHKIFD